VCIIDDRADVWAHAPNVVQVVPYNYFENTGDINAPPHLGAEGDGKLPDNQSEYLKYC